MTPNPPSDPRAVRTRRLLTDAVFALVGEQPYPSVSVKAIADAAGVNRATFYAHFVDKDDAVRQTVRAGIDRAIDERLGTGAGYSEAQLGTLVLAVFEFVEGFVGKYRDGGRELLPPCPESEIDARVADVIGVWLAERRAGAAAAVPEQIAAVTVASAITGAAWYWARQRKRPAAAEAARDVLAVVAAAFDGAAGRRQAHPPVDVWATA